MNPIPSPSPAEDARLHWLAQRGAEGLLSGEESAELSRRLAESEAARNLFAGYCQLLVLLEREPCVLDLLEAEGRPANVVPMPGVEGRCRVPAGAFPGGGTPGPARGRRGLVAAVLLATALVLGLLIPWTPHAAPEVGRAGAPVSRMDRVDPGNRPPAMAGPADLCEEARVLLASAGPHRSGVPAAISSRRPIAARPTLSLERDIRPLLSDTCLRCHHLEP